MYRLFVIMLLGLLASALALSDIHKQCIDQNSEPLSNDFLLGSWYMMYRFTYWGTYPPSSSCAEYRFTKPTAEVIAEYKAKYNDPNLPYSLYDNPVIRHDRSWVGMVTGNKIAKFYVLHPKDPSEIIGGYFVTAYRPLNDKFIMWQDCNMRGNTILLYARDRNASETEMRELINNTPELKRLAAQRYCAP